MIHKTGLAEGTKPHLVLGNKACFLSLYLSPTKRVCPLNQYIANHMTMMNDEGGGARGDEYGIFKTKSYGTAHVQVYNCTRVLTQDSKTRDFLLSTRAMREK